MDTHISNVMDSLKKITQTYNVWSDWWARIDIDALKRESELHLEVSGSQVSLRPLMAVAREDIERLLELAQE